MFCVISTVYLLGIEAKSYTEVRELNNGALANCIYESETLRTVGLSGDDVAFSAAAYRGESVYVSIKGKPEALYEIAVYNPSGKSSSSALVSKRAGKDGSVYWSWSVSDNISDGYIRVIVSGGNQYAQMKMEII